ncbi:MAG: isochorismatase family protein [Gemmatimonadota bacterium]
MADVSLFHKQLPSVLEYELPRHASGFCRANWALEPDRAALLIHDMQQYFLKIWQPDSPMIATLIANIRALRDRCDELGIPVFYTAQEPHANPTDRGLQADLWGPGMRDDPEDTTIISALAPKPEHERLRKWRYSAFQRSPLHPMLTARGRDQLIITGIYAQIGCLLTAADAFMLDIQPFFPVDGVADFSAPRHHAAVEYVAQTCGRTLSTSDLLEQL